MRLGRFRSLGLGGTQACRPRKPPTQVRGRAGLKRGDWWSGYLGCRCCAAGGWRATHHSACDQSMVTVRPGALARFAPHTHQILLPCAHMVLPAVGTECLESHAHCPCAAPALPLLQRWPAWRGCWQRWMPTRPPPACCTPPSTLSRQLGPPRATTGCWRRCCRGWTTA